jgi:hypothetical protein
MNDRKWNMFKEQTSELKKLKGKSNLQDDEWWKTNTELCFLEKAYAKLQIEHAKEERSQLINSRIGKYFSDASDPFDSFTRLSRSDTFQLPNPNAPNPFKRNFNSR